MARSLFRFIFAHSLGQQILLLLITLLSFPLLYATLELPKRIVNDAIQAEDTEIRIADLSLTQVEYLLLLCVGFLGAVLAWGLIKMRINTMKGVLAERLLRRFRYQLIARMLRFPLPHFRRTSQGELVSMVTAETEPLGGIMGDALAQPVFQAGQMLTIFGFLFVQSPYLGLAAVALVPVQAYLIPLIQRRINGLNKERVREVRRLSERIGDSVAGVGDLRANGGVPLALADFTHRLGRIFDIRFRIYRLKFFMKFLNNFITQLTPFFFYAIGGYLAIQGEITVGALVAAIAAYKDLAGPWKELLAYYNQTQDMSLRYQVIIDQFQPQGMIPAELFEGRPREVPRLTGDIAFEAVNLAEPDGAPVLEDITARIPGGATVGIRCASAPERTALTQLLSRAALPSAGRVRIGEHDLSTLHQGVVAARIGAAGTQPHLFNTTVGHNVQMPLRVAPRTDGLAKDAEAALEEALRAGNSADVFEGEWLDPSLAGVSSREELETWWYSIVEAMGTDSFLFDRGLGTRMDPARHPELAERLVSLRPRVEEALEAEGLADAVDRFDPDRFNPGLAIGGNLLFAARKKPLLGAELTLEPWFLEAIRGLGLEDDLVALGEGVLAALVTTFGEVGTAHPIYRRLGLGEDAFATLRALDERRRSRGRLSAEDRALLVALTFRLTPDQMGDAFPKALKSKILELRGGRCSELRARASDVFTPLDPGTYAEGLTLLENAIYGTMPRAAERDAERVREIVGRVLIEDGLKRAVALLIWDVEVGLGGANLPPVGHERIAVVRAVIKRPDILVLDRALASHDPSARQATRDKLRALLPETTLIFLEPQIVQPESYDLVLQIRDGRVVSAEGSGAEEALEPTAAKDLARKLRVLEKVSLFGGLDRAQLRLLAFSSQWFEAPEGEVLFRKDEAADGAYLLVSGKAELRWPEARPGFETVTDVEPGRLIGDLSVIMGRPRVFDMVVTEDARGLRIGGQELLDVIESDATVATSLLRTVSGYLNEVASRLRDARMRLPDGEVGTGD